MDYSKDLRIGPSGETPIRLVDRGIPLPDSWTYLAFAIAYPRSDGLVVGDGFPTASWTWDRSNLDQTQLDRILNLFTSATEASRVMRVRTPVGVGATALETDFECVVHRPMQGTDKQMVSQSRGPVWSGLTLRFTRLEAA